MIQIFNPSRLTRQPFLRDLVDYLDQHDEVILREIKAKFPDVLVDKYLEEYIKAGLILRPSVSAFEITESSKEPGWNQTFLTFFVAT